MEKDDYSARALQILGSFQLLEFALKAYIATCYGIIKAKLEQEIPFRYDLKSIDGFPLERLLNTFSQFNDNVLLQKRLNGLREKRNGVAHRALLYRHEQFRDVLGIDIASEAAHLEKTAVELDECLGKLATELQSVIEKYDATRA